MALTNWLRWLKGGRGLAGRIRYQCPSTVRAPRQRFVHRLDVLEERTLPSTFTVMNRHDGGPGSLRAAIAAANANPGPDQIKFADGVTGTIPLTSGQLDSCGRVRSTEAYPSMQIARGVRRTRPSSVLCMLGYADDERTRDE